MSVICDSSTIPKGKIRYVVACFVLAGLFHAWALFLDEGLPVCVLLFLASYSALRLRERSEGDELLGNHATGSHFTGRGAFRPDIQRQNMPGRGSSSGTKLGKAELGLGLCPPKFPWTFISTLS